jgi:hypothetical protein
MHLDWIYSTQIKIKQAQIFLSMLFIFLLYIVWAIEWDAEMYKFGPEIHSKLYPLPSIIKAEWNSVYCRALNPYCTSDPTLREEAPTHMLAYDIAFTFLSIPFFEIDKIHQQTIKNRKKGIHSIWKPSGETFSKPSLDDALNDNFESLLGKLTFHQARGDTSQKNSYKTVIAKSIMSNDPSLFYEMMELYLSLIHI